MSKLSSITVKYFLTLITAIVLSCTNGCGEDSVTTPTDNVDMSVMSSGDTLNDRIGILVLDTVKVLIKDIKLNVANNAQDSTNFKVGPYVLYLNLASSVNIINSAFIPVGTYDKVKFEIHKLEDSETIPDPDFADVNGRYSVVVKGRFSGISFVYKSNKSAHQKLTFPGNLQVSSNITLHIKPYIWFIKNGVYLDPGDPANESDIDNNIKDNINNNFKCFVDNDRNGQPD
jgi:hypothetical protein